MQPLVPFRTSVRYHKCLRHQILPSPTLLFEKSREMLEKAFQFPKRTDEFAFSKTRPQELHLSQLALVNFALKKFRTKLECTVTLLALCESSALCCAQRRHALAEHRAQHSACNRAPHKLTVFEMQSRESSSAFSIFHHRAIVDSIGTFQLSICGRRAREAI